MRGVLLVLIKIACALLIEVKVRKTIGEPLRLFLSYLLLMDEDGILYFPTIDCYFNSN